MVELTLENFEEHVNTDELTLVDWWGETCESCLAIMPVVEELAAEYGDKIKFAKFNTSQKGVKRFCIQQRILGLPVISIYKNNEKIDEISKDDCTKVKMIELITKHI